MKINLNKMKINLNKINLDKNNLILILTIFTIIVKYYLFIVFNTNLKIGIPKPINIIFNLSYLTCLIFIFINLKTDTKDKILLFIGTMITIISKNENILIYFLLAIYSKNNNINIKKIILYYTIISVIMFSIIFSLYMLGILNNGVYTHYRNGIPRIDFGFGNPNVPFLCLMPILTGYIYLKFDNYNIIDRVIIVSIVYYIYVNTYSRTGLIAIISTLLFIELVKILNIKIIKENKIFNFIFTNIFTIITIISIIVALFFNEWKYNVLLSSRPEYWNYYLKEISLIGFNKTTELIYPLDNSYIYLFRMFGLIFGIFIIYLINNATKQIIKEENKKLYSIIAMFSIYSFGENIYFDKALCPIFIIIVMYYLNSFKDFINKIGIILRRDIDEK